MNLKERRRKRKKRRRRISSNLRTLGAMSQCVMNLVVIIPGMLIVIFVVNLAISGVLVSIVQGSLLQQESSQLCPQDLCSYSQPYFLHSLPSFLQHYPQNDCILVEDPISQVVDVCNSDVFECLQYKLMMSVIHVLSQFKGV